MNDKKLPVEASIPSAIVSRVREAEAEASSADKLYGSITICATYATC
jgi:hypothetical protein